MNNFVRTRAMHQYYRDVFTRTIYLPEADALPAHIVVEVLNYANTDLTALEETIYSAETELEADQDKALKLMMCAILMANEAFDGRSQGQQTPMSEEKVAAIIDHVVEAMKLSDNINYLVAAIQILFRINAIESVLFLISQNLSTLSENSAVLKILLLVCLMEEDYNQAQMVIEQLTGNSDLIGEDPLTLVMVVCGIYKLGGYPDSFIDFRSLANQQHQLNNSQYEWLVAPVKNGRATVLVACDKAYYYEHAVALVLSVYETNRDILNVHLHIYNCDEELKRHLERLCAQLPGLNVSVSSEYFTARKAMNVHYACRRFVFLPHMLEAVDGPVMVLDADCLVRKPWSEVLTHFEDREIILSHHEGLPLWEQVPAGFIYTRGGDIANKYFAATARFIDINLSAGNAEWFLDQIALSFALDVLDPAEHISVGREAIEGLIDIKHSEEAFSWVVTTHKTGDGKYQEYKEQLKNKYLSLPC